MGCSMQEQCTPACMHATHQAETLCVHACVPDEPPEEDQFGRLIYLQRCRELGLSPVSQVQSVHQHLWHWLNVSGLLMCEHHVLMCSLEALHFISSRTNKPALALQVLKFLESEDMFINHYGLGIKGTLALVDALRVRQGFKRSSSTASVKVPFTSKPFQPG